MLVDRAGKGKSASKLQLEFLGSDLHDSWLPSTLR
jgi:hypothetical protein